MFLHARASQTDLTRRLGEPRTDGASSEGRRLHWDGAAVPGTGVGRSSAPLETALGSPSLVSPRRTVPADVKIRAMKQYADWFSGRVLHGWAKYLRNPRVKRSTAWYTNALKECYSKAFGPRGSNIRDAFLTAAHVAENPSDLAELLAEYWLGILHTADRAHVAALKARGRTVSRRIRQCGEIALQRLDPNDDRTHVDEHTLSVRAIELAVSEYCKQTDVTYEHLAAICERGLLVIFEVSLEHLGRTWRGPTVTDVYSDADFQALEYSVLESAPAQSDYEAGYEYASGDPRLADWAERIGKFCATYSFLLRHERSLSGRYLAFFAKERLLLEAERDGVRPLEDVIERLEHFAVHGRGSGHPEVRRARKLYDRILGA